MKIHNMLGSLTKVYILRVLISNYSAYSLYELRDMTFSSIGAIHKALKDLTSEKIVEEIKGAAKQRFYKINRNYPLEIIKLFEKEKLYYSPVPVHIWNYLSDFTNYFKKYRDVLGIHLFGSFARGEQRPNSDIDILIVSESKKKFTNIERFNQKIQNKLSILNLSKEDYYNLENKNSEFAIELKKGNIELYRRT